MKAILQSVIVSLSLLGASAMANEQPLAWDSVSDDAMKDIQIQAMQDIESELEKELPADLARHHQLINEQLFQQQPLKETVQKNQNNRKKSDNLIINYLNSNMSQGA
ncbi:hypothetical protein [uncultured Endozoicomonas sp.]|uniref:hypothetical protein n=1 Tax=uncultured Endozoicomonas sp. TaxID=432652 RepID=UPI00260B354A|nr:hypothetical protein [uncultured Endozoicomonas sp.]